MQDTWSTFHKTLKYSKTDRLAFEELRIFLAIPDPKSFAVTADNLLEILPLIEKIDGDNKWLCGKVPGWIKCCDQMLKQADVIEQAIPGFKYAGKNLHHPPLVGHYRTHPLGVALWCRVDTPELCQRYRLLQANLCVAHYYLRNVEEKAHYRSENIKYTACKAVRHLAAPENHDLLARLPQRLQSFHSYYKSLEGLKGIDADELLLNEIIGLFSIALEERKGINRSAKRGTRNSSDLFRKKPLKVAQSLEVGSEDGGLSSGEQITIFAHQGVSDHVLACQNDAGCSVDEFDSSAEMALVTQSGKDPSGGLSFRQQRQKLQMATAAIAMHNQRLSCDWERLTSHEVRTFLKELSQLSHTPSSIKGVPSGELAAFLAAMFWTSSTIERLCRCQVVTGLEKKEGSLHCLAQPGKPLQWLITPPLPPLKTKLSKSALMQALPTVPILTIAVPPLAAQIIRAYRGHPFVGTNDRKHVFSRIDTTYENAAETFLADLRRRTGGRQTLQRISMYLHDALSRAPGSDITIAMSVSGRSDVLGRVPQHYTAIPVERIQEIYGRVCSDISGTESLTVKGIATPLNRTGKYIGSSLVPSCETVEKLVGDLRGKLAVARARHDENDQSLKRLHNVLTVYTIMLVGFATGYRAVSDPLFQRAEIDHESGFAVISDKDNDDLYNSRLVWLPPVCIEQLDRYQAHLDFLQDHLFFLNQDLFFKVRGSAVAGRRPRRENPSFMYLTANTRNLPLKPRILSSLAGRVNYLLPANSNRHFLRSNLLARGSSMEVINAFFGHWERGNEPWGSLSGLSPMDYRDELGRYLVPLLEELGWAAEHGLVRGR